MPDDMMSPTRLDRRHDGALPQSSSTCSQPTGHDPSLRPSAETRNKFEARFVSQSLFNNAAKENIHHPRPVHQRSSVSSIPIQAPHRRYSAACLPLSAFVWSSFANPALVSDPAIFIFTPISISAPNPSFCCVVRSHAEPSPDETRACALTITIPPQGPTSYARRAYAIHSPHIFIDLPSIDLLPHRSDRTSHPGLSTPIVTESDPTLCPSENIARYPPHLVY